MNIGPFSFPVALFILLTSVAIAVVVARIAGQGASDAERVIVNSVIVGLVVGRLSFVAHYLPAYKGDVPKMLDFRDQGFDLLPGVVSGALLLLWMVARRAHVRRATIFAALAGVFSWSVATAFAGTGSESAYLPAVNVVDLNGKVQPLARNDGKPLVINLWASWCAPCRSEMPVLAQAQRELHGVDLEFVNQGESPATVSDFLASQRLSLQNLELDPSLAVAREVGARVFPTTLFYDGTGKLVAVHLGPFSRATFESALDILYPGAIVVRR
ncbi:redoxin family protein [Paraburkholderia sp. UCT31]|uniref:TlpA family protein disulfide reductase n=1 Tax=Paraburkholderia sp. UCT31 TaxID=2615209 RepID=UPI0016565DDE|nr:TlpA disulfide reductase family protein [Paraburkholderia sp. UCT31]MBC8740322.1 redoxin family protein [Paraburkholderia sp. UCT31]